MKKLITLCIVIMCTFVVPLNCFAKQSNETAVIPQTETQTLLETGYTEDGIYYETYGDKIEGSGINRLSYYVERTVVYDGRILPPQSIKWQENIGGFLFTGTLYIESSVYDASADKTTALYVGTITD